MSLRLIEGDMDLKRIRTGSCNFLLEKETPNEEEGLKDL